MKALLILAALVTLIAIGVKNSQMSMEKVAPAVPAINASERPTPSEPVSDTMDRLVESETAKRDAVANAELTDYKTAEEIQAEYSTMYIHKAIEDSTTRDGDRVSRPSANNYASPMRDGWFDRVRAAHD